MVWLGNIIDENSLQSCLNYLEDVQKLGIVSALDKLMSFNDRGIDLTKLPHSHETLRLVLLDAVAVIKRVAALKDTLYGLAQTVEKKLDERRAELWPSFLHCGIQMMPDEILSRIFEICVLDYEDEDTTSETGPEVVLSHVCSHFRSVALGTPLLWSRLSSNMSANWITSRLERSKSASLVVVIGSCGPYEKLKVFGKFVIPHSSRWRSFQFRTRRYNIPVYGASELFAEYFGKLHLPRVEHFLYHCDTADFDFSQVWSMPRTRHIDLFSGLPSLVSLSNSFPLENITSLAFTSNWFWKSSIEQLIFCLVSLPNLVKLYLHIDSPTYHIDVCEATLPKVTSFTFNTSEAGAFETVMSCLCVPSLDKLELNIVDHTTEEEEEEEEGVACWTPNNWLDHIRPGNFGSVRVLNFSFRNVFHQDIELNRLVRAFPGLEILNLDLEFNPAKFFFMDNLPPICSVSIKFTAELQWEFLEDFVDSLKESGRWETFEVFRVKRGTSLSRQQAEEILTKDKLQWYE